MNSFANFGQRLATIVRERQSAICVGLDPRWESLPSIFHTAGESPESRAAAVGDFCCQVVDAVADKVGVIKPQSAFFELLGPHGMETLHRVIRYCTKKELLVILDAKRNDIGSTAEGYASAYLGRGDTSVWGADALTVSPYLGDDSLTPFVSACDQRRAGIFVLVKTSNPGGGFLQDLRILNEQSATMQMVYQHVALHVDALNRSRSSSGGYGPIGAVVGATYPDQLSELRRSMPATWILVPGFGAQGGSAADVYGGFDDDGLGAIINNSRNIIFAHSRREFIGRFRPNQWQDAVSAAVVEMNEQLIDKTPAGKLKSN